MRNKGCHVPGNGCITMPRRLSACAACLICLALCANVFAGVAQPGMVLAGAVYDAAGKLMTEGELTITYTPTGGGADVVLSTPLASITGPAGALSYAIITPLEMPAPDSPVAPTALRVAATPTAYTRVMRVTGTAIVKTDAVEVSTNSIGAVRRVDLREGDVVSEGEVEPGLYHSGDLNRDRRFSLYELLRMIELYTATDTHEYHCDPWGEDGYHVGLGPRDCAPHSGDYDGDWRFSMDELLRMIELFAATPDHAYCPDPTGIDGFRPGACDVKTPGLKKRSAPLNLEGLRMQRTIWEMDAADGKPMGLYVTIAFEAMDASVAAVGVEEWLPEGWTYAGVVGGDAPSIAPKPGKIGELAFAWFPVPRKQGSFTYAVIPVGDVGLDKGMHAYYGESVHRIEGMYYPIRLPLTSFFDLVDDGDGGWETPGPGGGGGDAPDDDFPDYRGPDDGYDGMEKPDDDETPAMPLRAWPVALAVLFAAVAMLELRQWKRKRARR